MTLFEVDARQLVKAYKIVEPGGEIPGGSAHVRLERLFEREVGEEQPMPNAVLFQKFTRNLPVLNRTAPPMGDLFRDIYHACRSPFTVKVGLTAEARSWLRNTSP